MGQNTEMSPLVSMLFWTKEATACMCVFQQLYVLYMLKMSVTVGVCEIHADTVKQTLASYL